jgi:acyl-CoA reductase-like NAD-dependent aldehyde dehydrogenase
MAVEAAGRAATSFPSLDPATGEVVGVHPLTGREDVHAAVARARDAGAWWAGLGFDHRKARLRAWKGVIARRLEELAELVHRENGKPSPDAVLEIAATLDHLDWAARKAAKVLGPRRVPPGLTMLNHAASVEYQPLGVVGVIGPWNYPVLTPMGSIAYALAAGNAVVFKPSEYTPGIGRWLADRWAEVVPERPVLQVITGDGGTGAALCRAGVDKLAFTGSARTGRAVLAACAERLTPVLLECGGKDALIVDADADLDAAADAALWGGLSNAGQTCIGVERVLVADAVYEPFVEKLRAGAARVRPGAEPGAGYGPITMPGQLDVIRRHLGEAFAGGARALVGGPEAVHEPYVDPVVLVDVPEDADVLREETFGPVLTVERVRDADEAVARANDSPYGLGSAVFSRRRGVELARRLRTGMTSVNAVMAFAAVPSLPFGGRGESGFGRIHGEDGLKEFTRAKAITRQRFPSPLAVMTFRRAPDAMDRVVALIRLVHGRS